MRRLIRYFVMPALAGIVIVILAFGVLPIPGIQAIAEVSHPNDIFAEIYRDASPSVVAISVVTKTGGGNGSGFVIDREGHIVTNAHLVDEADEIAVEFFEGGIYRAQLVGLDLASDIAVIKVNAPASQLNPIRFANSDELVVGQTVARHRQPIPAKLDADIGHHQRPGSHDTEPDPIPDRRRHPDRCLDQSGQQRRSFGSISMARFIGVNAQIISGSRSSSGVGFADSVQSNAARRRSVD